MGTGLLVTIEHAIGKHGIGKYGIGEQGIGEDGIGDMQCNRVRQTWNRQIME